MKFKNFLIFIGLFIGSIILFISLIILLNWIFDLFNVYSIDFFSNKFSLINIFFYWITIVLLIFSLIDSNKQKQKLEIEKEEAKLEKIKQDAISNFNILFNRLIEIRKSFEYKLENTPLNEIVEKLNEHGDIKLYVLKYLKIFIEIGKYYFSIKDEFVQSYILTLTNSIEYEFKLDSNITKDIYILIHRDNFLNFVFKLSEFNKKK